MCGAGACSSVKCLVLCPAAVGRARQDAHTKLHRASNVISLSLPHGNALVPQMNVAAAASHQPSLVHPFLLRQSRQEIPAKKRVVCFGYRWS